MSSVRPLSGIVVVEIGHSIAAPYAGMILGELGAEVIKVENPKGGDACRGWGPPFTEGTATAFHAFNRAKLGITIDLSDPAEIDKLRALIRDRADVLIHNLKHGTLDRYGLSADALLAEKPYLANGEIPARHGSGIEQIVPYQAFETADGFMMVAAGNDNLFRRLCAAIDRPGLAEDPRFRTNGDRVVNRRSLIPILADIFAAAPVAAWVAKLDAAGIPNSPIQTLDQVVADAQTAALGIIQQWPGSPALSLVGLPLSFDGARPSFATPAPKLGEGNAEIIDREV